jgi:[acyl-carrier-protein] S-malonyltransferase
MGRTLYETLPAARRVYEEASRVLNYDLADLCFRGPEEKLNSTAISQPAIFVTSLAALECLRANRPDALRQCSAATGLSLGEYTALVFAGALTFQDGLEVVRRRALAMQVASDAVPSGMVSILGLEPARVEEICDQARGGETLEIANLLCPGNVVVSGTKAACDAVERLAGSAGGRTIRLAVAGAFHTVLMRPADQQLAEALARVPLGPPRIPVWSNVDAQPHTDPEEIRSLLIRQVLQPVLWEQTMRNLLAAGYASFYEIGPGRVLLGLLKRVQRRVDCHSISV